MFSASYKIYPDIGLVYYQIEGKAVLAKMIEFYEKIYHDPDFNVNFKGVGDWRKVESNFSREEVIELSKFVIEQKLSNGHWVALVDSPMLTAFSQIYSDVVAPQHPLEACSTVKHASKVLKIDLSLYIQETDELN